MAPTWTTIVALLGAMGEQPALVAERMAVDADPVHLTAHARRTPAERLELALSWNRLAGELRAAGRAVADG